MADTPEAILAFGYDLGPKLGQSLEDAKRKLISVNRRALGQPPTPPEADLDRELFDRRGLTFLACGDSAEPSHILTTRFHKTDWEQVEVISTLRNVQGARSVLNWAVGVLGIDVGDEQPSWLLAVHLPV